MLFIYSIFISFVFVVEFTHGSHHLDRNHHHVFIWKLLVDNAIENVGEMDLNTTTTEQQAKLAITTEYNTGPINKLFKGSATADMTLITNLSNIRNGDHIIIVQYIENFRFVSVYHLRGNANYFMGYMYLNCTTTAKQAKEAIKSRFNIEHINKLYPGTTFIFGRQMSDELLSKIPNGAKIGIIF